MLMIIPSKKSEVYIHFEANEVIDGVLQMNKEGKRHGKF